MCRKERGSGRTSFALLTARTAQNYGRLKPVIHRYAECPGITVRDQYV